MKRHLFGFVIASTLLTLSIGAAATQVGRVQSKQRVQASHAGGPIQTCHQGANCKPDDQLRQMAGDGGGPIPTCRPGTNCKPDDQLREVAGDGRRLGLELAFSVSDYHQSPAGLS